MHIDNVKFLILSKFAYTKFSEKPLELLHESGFLEPDIVYRICTLVNPVMLRYPSLYILLNFLKNYGYSYIVYLVLLCRSGRSGV